VPAPAPSFTVVQEARVKDIGTYSTTTEAEVGDVVNYRVTIANTGGIDFTTGTLSDILPSGLTLNATSIRINGIAPTTIETDLSNLTIPALVTESTPLVITFDANVINLDSTITNRVTVNYSYADTIEPLSVISNEVTTSLLLKGDYEVEKLVGVNGGVQTTTVSSSIGDTLNYRITVTNTGNIELNSGTLSDILPAGLVLIPSSIRINSTNPTTIPTYLSNLALPSLPVGTISQPSTTVVEFNARVSETTGSLNNTANLTYNTPTGIISKISNAAIVNLIELNADFTVTKEATVNGLGVPSKNISAIVGDTINFIVSVTNTGNVALTDGSFNKFLSGGLKLDKNLVTVNEESIVVAGDGLTNIPLGELPIGTTLNPSTTIIKFNAIITSEKNSISDIDTISYKGVETSLALLAKDSNAVIVNVQPTADYSVVKEVRINKQDDYSSDKMANEDDIVNPPSKNPDFIVVKEVRTNESGNYAASTTANQGDTVNYRITITNTGNVTFNNGGTLTDILNDNLSIDANSVFVGNTIVPVIGNNLNNITLPPLNIGSSITVRFNAKVLSNGIDILDEATPITYNYTGQISPTTKNSTIAKVNANLLGMTKIVCSKSASLGTILTYTVVLTNNSLQPLNNIVLNDLLDSNLTLVPGSIYVNGVLKPIELTLNNLSLSSLPVTTPKSSNTVTFSAKVTGVGTVVTNQATATYLVDAEHETRTAASNVVTTTISAPCISVAKSVNLCQAMIKDTLRYTITITNRGNVKITNIILADKLDERLEVVPGSVRINGAPPLQEKVDIHKLSLPDLLATTGVQTMTTLTITFDAVIKDIKRYLNSSSMYCQETSKPFTVCNHAMIAYGFDGEVIGVLKTNRVSTDIIIPSPRLTAVKSVSSECARVGDILTYTIILNNTGNVPLTGIVLSDIVPTNLIVNPSTIKISGVSVSRATANTLMNLKIPNMPVPPAGSLEPIVVTFDVTVGSMSSNSVFNRRPCIQNMATVTYRRVGSRFSMTTNTNTVSTRITNNSSKYDAFVPINLSPCDPLVDTVLQVTPTVRSISPSSQKYNIVINVLYSIVLSYKSADGKMKEITKYYKVEIPNPGYTVSTNVTVNSVGNPIIIKGHQVNVKLRFNITN